MFPNQLFLGITLYDIFLCIAVIAAILVYRLLSDKRKLEAKLYNFGLFTAVGAIVCGFFSAYLFQAFYNYLHYKEFFFGGFTFYGGLIGGAGFFLLIYFLVGKKVFKENKLHIKRFFDVADIAACSITIAHAFGRVGCLMAGCCHGKRTDAWYGINMWVDNYNNSGYTGFLKVAPTQLFEALFLAILFYYLILRVKDKQTYCLQIYMIVYGIWRFIIEYMRADYRGSSFVESLTPSQFIAILMLLGGAALAYLQYRIVSANAENAKKVVADGNATEKNEIVTTVETTAEVEAEEDDDYEYASEYQKKDADSSKAENSGDVNDQE